MRKDNWTVGWVITALTLFSIQIALLAPELLENPGGKLPEKLSANIGLLSISVSGVDMGEPAGNYVAFSEEDTNTSEIEEEAEDAERGEEESEETVDPEDEEEAADIEESDLISEEESEYPESGSRPGRSSSRDAEVDLTELQETQEQILYVLKAILGMIILLISCGIVWIILYPLKIMTR